MGETASVPALSSPRPRQEGAAGGAPEPTAGTEAGLLLLNLFAVAALSLLDAFTPPGIVVGMLLVIPILASATSNRPRDVTWVFAAAALGYGLAAIFGSRTPPPQGAWLHNRVLVVAVLVSTAYFVLALQQRRLRLAGRKPPPGHDLQEVNRLLMSLIVHDLRSPLTTALHTLDYLEQRIPDSSEDEMIAEARARLRRNLRLIDAFLAVTHADQEGTPQAQRSRKLTSRQFEDVLHEEIGGFRAEAAGRNKQVLLYHETPEVPDFTVDLLVLRHALTILVDNAVRYALPGPIRVTTRIASEELTIAVEDSGPGTSSSGERPSGAGLGLQLCAALLRRAGGDLSRLKDGPEGSCFMLRLPLHPNGTTTGPAAAASSQPAGFRAAAR